MLLRKPPAKLEFYNDLDKSIVNLFRVLRDKEQSEELQRLLFFTPFSRVELDNAYEPTSEPVEAARRLLVRSWMSYSNRGTGENIGFIATNQKDTTHHTAPPDTHSAAPYP